MIAVGKNPRYLCRPRHDGVHLYFRQYRRTCKDASDTQTGTFTGLCFVNLVDFDMLYGHRRNPDGYAQALQEFDSWLPQLLAKLGEDDCVMITADHGCDPGYLKHTDHTREYIPMIALGKKIKPVNLGTRAGFCDIAATVTELLGVPYQTPGKSFAAELV